MALRNIRKLDDEIFRKKAREVNVIDNKILTFLDDLVETMRKENAIGLSAMHVGVLKRIVVADIGEGLIEIINPKIISESGEQIGEEGSVSLPGRYGDVKRPQNIIVEGLNRKGEKIIVSGEGLLARVLCHEIDHLDGIIFTDKVIRYKC
ncbi:peptide deformylase [Pseudobacteroides cellulosolvens]|uniref:Peptide deformylase-like n=1 Tax=Pseudobacteroides cellulosolvens ATCC 35603 = DSM 2933 TaxID=398512 RepID=A0A0L6JWT1_9FIRM|nr:peptide deformylase [Pseudobacteroides cellulosolvens]KNY30303.1 Peptide deformylase [Pseudobacteroides cellulosolvens ATCC 35603 = DSM 2933]